MKLGERFRLMVKSGVSGFAATVDWFLSMQGS